MVKSPFQFPAGADDMAPGRVCVARQPIFDPSYQVVAYELLHRTACATSACIVDPACATAEVLTRAMLDIGMTRLVGEHPAFVNIPAEMIVGPMRIPLDPARIVVELPERTAPDAEVLAGLGRLRNAGFRVALDDFDLRVDSHALLDFADIVKVDVLQHDPQELASSVATLRRWKVKLVAEKVETVEELRRCVELGFDYLQGYFLQRPEVFSNRRAPSSRITVLQLICALSEQGADVADLESCVARDIGLSYRILRCINSSYYQMSREVHSLQQAIMLLGFDELRRICVLLMLADVDDRPSYVSISALARARMCESLCVMAGGTDGGAFFMAGLMSMIDVLLGLPLDEALRDLPLGEDMEAGLLEAAGRIGAAIECAKRYERGDWDRALFPGLAPDQIRTAYTHAVGWAEDMLRTA